MRELFLTLLIVAILLLLLLRLLLERNNASGEIQGPLEQNQGNFLPLHCRYFTQVRQALSAADAEYLRERAAVPVVKKALRERRKVAKRFLAGLSQDFSNLERLARTVAALSPEINRQQETERLILSLKFRVLYAWVWLRLSTGNVPLPAIESLTGLVGRIATQMQQAMMSIQAMTGEGLDTNLSA